MKMVEHLGLIMAITLIVGLMLTPIIQLSILEYKCRKIARLSEDKLAELKGYRFNRSISLWG